VNTSCAKDYVSTKPGQLQDGVAVAVVCGGKVAAQTDVVPLSKDGNAKIDKKVSVPSDCVNPVIVLRERYEGKIGGWLAATGR